MYIQKHGPGASYQATIACASENLIYMIQCREYKNTLNAPAEYIGQTKRALRDRFGEHRRAIQNKTTDAVPQHFKRKGHKLRDIKLIPLKLINSKRESILRAINLYFLHFSVFIFPLYYQLFMFISFRPHWLV